MVRIGGDKSLSGAQFSCLAAARIAGCLNMTIACATARMRRQRTTGALGRVPLLICLITALRARIESLFIPAGANEQSVVAHGPGVLGLLLAGGGIGEDIVYPQPLLGRFQHIGAEMITGGVQAQLFL